MDPEIERQIAKTTFNDCWKLLGKNKNERTKLDDAQMLNLAHASRYHWGNVGEPKEFAIGEWQISRVNAEIGNAAACMFHAELCKHWTDMLPDPSFMAASAAEGLSRAYYVSGNLEEAIKHKQLAKTLLVGVPEVDGKYVQEDIDSLPF